MGFHFAKQKKRILVKTSILSKIPFYPEKPSRLLENFHFALFLEFDQFFACFVLKFEQILNFRSFRFQNFGSSQETQPCTVSLSFVEHWCSLVKILFGVFECRPLFVSSFYTVRCRTCLVLKCRKHSADSYLCPILQCFIRSYRVVTSDLSVATDW